MIIICKKCGWMGINAYDPPACMNCKSIELVEADLTIDDWWKLSKEECRAYADKILKEHGITPVSEEERQSMKKSNTSTLGVACPYCKGRNTRKISTGSRMLSVGFWGLGSKKIGKQWHCNNCGSDF